MAKNKTETSIFSHASDVAVGMLVSWTTTLISLKYLNDCHYIYNKHSSSIHLWHRLEHPCMGQLHVTSLW